MGVEGFAGIEVEHFGIGGNGAAFANKAVDGLLAFAGDREIVRDAELVSGGIEQPVADFAVLLGAVELAEGEKREEQQE
jgi:hypothetical protein